MSYVSKDEFNKELQEVQAFLEAVGVPEYLQLQTSTGVAHWVCGLGSVFTIYRPMTENESHYVDQDKVRQILYSAPWK